PLEECVGSPFYGGLGMDKSDHKNAHLLPLLISFDKKGIVQKPTLLQNPVIPERPYAADPVPGYEKLSPSHTSPVNDAVPKKELVRKTRVQKTILLESPNITIALYDNGEIDGDIATLLLDGKVIIDKHPLSTKPAIISLLLSNGKEEHVLEMFADNLGSIPPNTALVVLTCNQKRYEINLSSSEKINEGVKLIVK
ncbi:MAG: hypothetical protein KGO92_14475, partial [Bacteroidota bacterium]|nr:hypothetical protein [Bacteroidota bacterium]